MSSDIFYNFQQYPFNFDTSAKKEVYLPNSFKPSIIQLEFNHRENMKKIEQKKKKKLLKKKKKKMNY